jgi:hypothetical protein
MANIFTVDSGDATAIQQHYEQVIEALLRAILDAKQDLSERQELKIFDGDRLVYGRDGNGFRDEVSGLSGQLLNPQLIAQLQQLRATPVGEIVEGAINKRVELGGEVILQSDKDGRVIVNSLLQQEKALAQTPEQALNEGNLADKNGFKAIESPEILLRDNNIQSAKVPTNKNLNSSMTPGSERVMQSLQALPDSPLKTLLSAEVEQLQAEIKALQQERSLYQQLIQQRLKQPQNTSWWQQTINNVSVVFSSLTFAMKMGIREFKDNSAKHQGAISLKNLFDQHTPPGASSYQAGNYQISRDGSSYEVKELTTGKQIMEFRSTPMGIKVEGGELSNEHIKDIDDLQRSLKSLSAIPASFAPVGQQEAEYFARVNKVAIALVQYAATQQKEVEIDGAFSYKWTANPDGGVRIDAKDGRGTLLEKSGGKLNSQMSERDLIYFEQILPKLQPACTQQNITNYQSQKFANNGLER